MTRNRLVAVLVVAGVVLASVVVALVRHRGPDPTPAATATSTGSPSPSATPLAGATTSKRGSANSEIAPVQTFPAGATPSEGLPGVSTPTPTSAPILHYTITKAAFAKGRVVRGFPVRAVPTVPSSAIQVSSVSPSPGRLQIALTATTPASHTAILRFYSVQLAKYGFVSAPAPAVGGSYAASYTRGQDALVVSITPAGGTSTYSVSGTLLSTGT